MNWNFLGHNWHLFGNLAVLAFVALLVFATCMSVYTARLRKQAVSPLAHSVGGYPFVLSKVRKDPDGLVHQYHCTGAAYEAPERAPTSSIRAACVMDIW
ncbi:Uncharacterised protein [Mycobacteroides abscessus subsp. abscessus]|nr:Uncharacterised protein [Mycobacteroides abscessus subsp. abscessus]